MANGRNGQSERDLSGRFAKGNKAATGRPKPHAATVAALRRAMLEAVSPDDIRDVFAALVKQAKSGDVPAAKELLNRVLGRVPASDLILVDDEPKPLLLPSGGPWDVTPDKLQQQGNGDDKTEGS